MTPRPAVAAVSGKTSGGAAEKRQNERKRAGAKGFGAPFFVEIRDGVWYNEITETALPPRQAGKGYDTMKLITAIVNKEDAKQVCNHLIQEGFSVTRLSTTGGFLMAGNMTLMIGTDDEKVDPCIQIIAQHCKQRTEVVPSTASYGIGVATAYPLQVTVGGATIFVTNVERFEKL